MKDISRVLVKATLSLRDSLRRLNDESQKILLITDDEGKLLCTVTDGDIRRLLLAGASLDDTLEALDSNTPITAHELITPLQALQLMDSHYVDHLPIVDDDGCVVSILVRREIDRPILLSTPHMSDFERSYVEDAFATNWVAPVGPNIDAFENEFAEYVGISHAAALSSGTAAIHLALRVLGVGAGDRVFCSSLTFVASANPILYQGATPVFIDSEPDSWNISPQALTRALSDADREGKLPSVVIVVGLYGQSPDMTPILEVCNRYQVPVVEDAAESLGATYKNRASGTLGKVGIYSFNGNKIITTSGGGILVSDDADLVEYARFLSTQGRDPARHYQHSQVGYNYRMSNILAGIGRGQLKVLDEHIRARRSVFTRYADGLSDIGAIRWMPEATFGSSTRWLTACVLDPEETDVSPDQLIDALAEERIEARPVWKPMHLQPLFEACRYYPHEEGVSISTNLFENGICLPSGSNLQESQQARVIDALRRVLKGDI